VTAVRGHRHFSFKTLVVRLLPDNLAGSTHSESSKVYTGIYDRDSDFPRCLNWAASLGKPAVTAIIRENRRIPDAVAVASAVCFSCEPSDHHKDLI
jgi:hypothetical protein